MDYPAKRICGGKRNLSTGSEKPMRICLIATEFKGIGPYGGFGTLTYDIATGLAARGLDVYVAMPRKDGQAPVERIGNVTVLSYPSPLYVGFKEVLPYAGVYRMIDADIYHSEEPSLGTALAQIACPHKKHLVTFQDPRDYGEWTVEWAHRNMTERDILKYYQTYLRETGRAAQRADSTYCQAKYIIDKAQKMYGLRASPSFLPNPIRMGELRFPKAKDPAVCYVGRWDERKRPELFFELAARFPTVRFIAVGACMNNSVRDQELRQRYRTLTNVEMPGWLGGDELSAILDKSWVLVNTSTRECLPVTFLEASAHKCAILSYCNPDGFASNFGFWAQKGDLDDFEQGLRFLLQNNEWKNRGRKRTTTSSIRMNTIA
jgi:glycosyltransferase involved in cell wall biosynthesis